MISAFWISNSDDFRRVMDAARVGYDIIQGSPRRYFLARMREKAWLDTFESESNSHPPCRVEGPDYTALSVDYKKLPRGEGWHSGHGVLVYFHDKLEVSGRPVRQIGEEAAKRFIEEGIKRRVVKRDLCQVGFYNWPPTFFEWHEEE